jgi:type VI secretion system protein ImpA
VKAQTYDRELLLHPISPDSPAGESLRYDPLYDQIVQARLQEAPLSQGVWQRPTQQADWQLVEELCGTALATRSKDLQIAVWLTEAWLHLYGLPGFISGCGLLCNLQAEYLLELFPVPQIPHPATNAGVALPLDAGDPAIEHRLNMMQWMNDKLSIEIKLLPLTAPVEGSNVAALSLADIEAAQHDGQAARRAGLSRDTVNLDGGFARSLSLTPADHIVQTWNELRSALEAVDDLGAALDRFYGPSNSGLLQIRDVLGEMAQAIKPALPRTETVSEPAREGSSQPALVTPTSPDNALEDSGQPRDVAAPVAGIQSREEAYALLEEVAEYLAKIEPHSPVPYLIRRGIAWGGMAFHEMVKDPAVMSEMSSLLRFDVSGKASV